MRLLLVRSSHNVGSYDTAARNCLRDTMGSASGSSRIDLDFAGGGPGP
jgi:hypothetical protein